MRHGRLTVAGRSPHTGGPRRGRLESTHKILDRIIELSVIGNPLRQKLLHVVPEFDRRDAGDQLTIRGTSLAEAVEPGIADLPAADGIEIICQEVAQGCTKLELDDVRSIPSVI